MISIKKSLFLKIKNVLDKGYILKRGKEEAKIQIARRMSKLGFNVKEISEIMKISEKDVNKMLDSNKLEIDENAEK